MKRTLRAVAQPPGRAQLGAGGLDPGPDGAGSGRKSSNPFRRPSFDVAGS